MKTRLFWISCILAIPASMSACESVGADGLPVWTLSETAIIVYDSGSHTEHFIRKASFQTKAKGLGFLVPTPTLPKLSPVEDDAFAKLHYAVERLSTPYGEATAGAVAADASKSDDPVLKQEHVGGYLATCLSLANPNAVDEWLVKNKFPSSNRTKEWLKPYVQKRWVIAAFKLEVAADSADLKSIDLAFTTDKPFYPYREPPQDPSKSGRQLRVMFLPDGPMEATMGSADWVGHQEASGSLDDYEISDLQPLLPGTDLKKTSWLTSFVDPSSPRDGKDEVYFERASPTRHLGRIAVYFAVFLLGAVTLYKFLTKRRRNPSP